MRPGLLTHSVINFPILIVCINQIKIRGPIMVLTYTVLVLFCEIGPLISHVLKYSVTRQKTLSVKEW